MAFPGTPCSCSILRQGGPPAPRQIVNPRRLAEAAAIPKANVAQPAAANPARQEGFYQDDRLFDPALRYVRNRMELIHGEEELWAERS